MVEKVKNDEVPVSFKTLKKMEKENKQKKSLEKSDDIVKKMSDFINAKDQLSTEEVLIIEQFRENRENQKNTIKAELKVTEKEEVGHLKGYYEESLPLVPKEVDAFMVEYHDKKEKNVREAFEIISIMKLEYPKAFDWIMANPDTFAMAWVKGRDILPDKIYITQAPNINNPDEALFLTIDENDIVSLLPKRHVTYKHRITLTEEEIDQDFGWFRSLALSTLVQNEIYGIPEIVEES